jgi:hypothetical protein
MIPFVAGSRRVRTVPTPIPITMKQTPAVVHALELPRRNARTVGLLGFHLGIVRSSAHP